MPKNQATLSSFNPKACDVVAKEMLAALDAVAQKYGLIFERGNGKYTADTFTLPITAKVTGGGTLEDVQRRDFVKHCVLYDMKPEEFGLAFTAKGDSYKIIGFDLKRPKFCIKTIRQSDGKESSWSDRVLEHARAQNKRAA